MLSWVDSGLSDIPEHMYEGSYIYAKQHWIPSGNDYASISIDGGESFSWDIQNDYEFILDGYEDDNRTATIAITDNWNYTDYGYLVIENVQPAAELSYDPGDGGGDYTLNLSDSYDPSGADTSAGFTYAFANTYADLSEPGNLTSTPSHAFDLQDSDGVVWARIYDKDGGYSDYNTSYVLPTINLGQITDTEVNIAWLDVATGETAWLVQRAPYGGSFTTIATLDPNSTDYTDTSVDPATKYQYRIRASGTANTAADTAYSAKRTVKTYGAPTAVLGQDGPLYTSGTGEFSFRESVDPNGLPLRYSFANSSGALAETFDDASARPYGTLELSDETGSETFYGRVINSAGYYTDYSISRTIVAPPNYLTAPLSVELSLWGDPGDDVILPMRWSVLPVSASVRYAFALDSDTLPATYADAPTSGAPPTLDFSALADGTHTLHGKVYDSGGVDTATDDFTFTLIKGTSSTDTFLVKAASSTSTSVWKNGVQSVYEWANCGLIVIYGLGGADSFTVDHANGEAFSEDGLAAFGGAGVDSAVEIGTSGDDQTGAGLIDSATLKSWYVLTESLVFNLGDGNDTVIIDTLDLFPIGSITINGGAGNDIIRIGSGTIGSLLVNGDGSPSGDDPGNDTIIIDHITDCSSLTLNGGYGQDQFVIDWLENVGGIHVNGYTERPNEEANWDGDGGVPDRVEIVGEHFVYESEIYFDAGGPHTYNSETDDFFYPEQVENTVTARYTGEDDLTWVVPDRNHIIAGSITLTSFTAFEQGVDDLSLPYNKAGVFLSGGEGVDTFHLRDGDYFEVDGGLKNDVFNVTGQDTIPTGGDPLYTGGAGRMTLLGGAGDDLLLVGLDPGLELTDPRHGSLAGLSDYTEWYGGEGYDTIEVYDDTNETDAAQHYRMTNGVVNKWSAAVDGYQIWFGLSFYSSTGGRVENMILHMQNGNASQLSSDMTITTTPQGASVTIVPGALDEVIDVDQYDGIAALPVHIKPSLGKSGSTGGDRVTVRSTGSGSQPTKVIFDYSATTPLKLYELKIEPYASVTMNPDSPTTFLMDVANLVMYRNDENRYATLDLGVFGVKASAFSDILLDASTGNPIGSPVTGMSGLQTYLDIGYNAGDWNGVTGVRTDAHYGDPTDLTPIIAMVGSDYLSHISSVSAINGSTVEASDLIVRCTFRGDATLNGVVDILDLYQFAIHFNPNHTPPATSIWTEGDFTGDGWVDSYDLAVIAAHWQDGTGFATAKAMFGL